MKITRYGTRQILWTSVLDVAVCAALVWAAVAVHPAFWIALVLPAVGAMAVTAFFRDPERTPPDGSGLFVVPADGRVADVTPLGADGELGCDAVKIGVFMSLADVHVNRSPADGRVDRIEHRDGTYLDARDPHASDRNEAAAIRMTCRDDRGEFPIIVRQVAGLVARRIVTDLSEGQTVARGERIGMIKFGSRLELVVPRSRTGRVRVSVGDRVTAGETVLIDAGEADHE